MHSERQTTSVLHSYRCMSEEELCVPGEVLGQGAICGQWQFEDGTVAGPDAPPDVSQPTASDVSQAGGLPAPLMCCKSCLECACKIRPAKDSTCRPFSSGTPPQSCGLPSKNVDKEDEQTEFFSWCLKVSRNYKVPNESRVLLCVCRGGCGRAGLESEGLEGGPGALERGCSGARSSF